MEKCKGHICFITRPNSNRPWEFFTTPNGDLFRAPSDSPIDLDTGYRMGSRFEATKWGAETVLRLARGQ
jgi:hypothetical protein